MWAGGCTRGFESWFNKWFHCCHWRCAIFILGHIHICTLEKTKICPAEFCSAPWQWWFGLWTWSLLHCKVFGCFSSICNILGCKVSTSVCKRFAIGKYWQYIGNTRKSMIFASSFPLKHLSAHWSFVSWVFGCFFNQRFQQNVDFFLSRTSRCFLLRGSGYLVTGYM